MGTFGMWQDVVLIIFFLTVLITGVPVLLEIARKLPPALSACKTAKKSPLRKAED